MEINPVIVKVLYTPRNAVMCDVGDEVNEHTIKS